MVSHFGLNRSVFKILMNTVYSEQVHQQFTRSSRMMLLLYIRCKERTTVIRVFTKLGSCNWINFKTKNYVTKPTDALAMHYVQSKDNGDTHFDKTGQLQLNLLENQKPRNKTKPTNQPTNQPTKKDKPTEKQVSFLKMGFWRRVHLTVSPQNGQETMGCSWPKWK